MKRVAAVASLIGIVCCFAPAANADSPTVSSPIIAGTPGANGWYVSTVTVTYNVTGTSFNTVDCGTWHITPQGLQGVVTLGADGANQSASCSVSGPDGSAASPSASFNIDKTAPLATSIALQRAPDSNGWYNHIVGVSVTGSDATSGIASCTSPTYSGPDSGAASVSGTCTDVAGNVSAPASLTLSYDATPPSAAATPARGADANGWYNHAVAVAFSGSDATSGIASCTSGSYAGPDSGSAAVAGTCTDKAGNSASASFGLQYDATPPAVSTATPDRPPDANGWYNHALNVAFAGADGTSGIAGCDTATYDKPNDTSAQMTGRCTDNAGNASAPGAFAFKYDSTPPTLGSVQVTSLDGRVTLTWKASDDVAAMTIARSRVGASPVTLYNGKRETTFTDKGAKNGYRYTYLLTASDVAGNAVVLKALATPTASLLAPRAAAKIHGTATLRWRPVKKASYYNVQVWLDGKKFLTTWPAGTALKLPKLKRGRYTWFVWPGLGPRAKHRYGPLIGKSTFVVTR